MRRLGLSSVVTILVCIIAVGAIALASNPNRPPDCEPCQPQYSPSEPTICPFTEGHNTVQGYTAGGTWVGLFSNRCVACTFGESVYCTVPGSGTPKQDLPDS